MDMIQGRMDLAVQYGADVAIFVHNVVYWTEKNAANRVNFHDGRYWTYNSMRALCELYPLWTRDQIRRIVKKCEDLGLILVGNYNEKPMDRTQWYSPTDKILMLYGLGVFATCIGENRHMEAGESPHASGENPTAIPSIDQGSTKLPPYNPPTGDSKPRGNAKQSEPKEAPDWKPERFASFWTAYPRGQSKQAAIKAWDKLRPDDSLLQAMAKGLRTALASEDWQRGIGIPYASTWINQRRWEDELHSLPAAQVPPQMAPERFGWD